MDATGHFLTAVLVFGGLAVALALFVGFWVTLWNVNKAAKLYYQEHRPRTYGMTYAERKAIHQQKRAG